MTLPAAYFDGDGDPTRLDQPSDHHDKHASWQTDASGNVVGLVGPGGLPINAYPLPPNPAGMDWLTDTISAIDIYKLGLVQRPTIFFDPQAADANGRGTFAKPYSTAAQLNAAITRLSKNNTVHIGGQVIGLKRGSKLLGGLSLTLAGSSAEPVFLVPYGDAEALPIISGGSVYTWTNCAADGDANVWKTTVGATEPEVFDQGYSEIVKRFLKKTWNTNIATTALTAGRATYNSNTLYVRPFADVVPNWTLVEVSTVANALAISYTDIAASGFINICGLHTRSSYDSALSIQPGTSASLAAIGEINVVGCKSGQAGLNESGSVYGSDAILIYGLSDGVRVAGANVLACNNYDALNNSVELGCVSSGRIAFNKSDYIQGPQIAELWYLCSGVTVERNVGKLIRPPATLLKNFGTRGIWCPGYDVIGGTSTDSAKNTGNKYLHNVIDVSANTAGGPGIEHCGNGALAYNNIIIANNAGGSSCIKGVADTGAQAQTIDIRNNFLLDLDTTWGGNTVSLVPASITPTFNNNYVQGLSGNLTVVIGATSYNGVAGGATGLTTGGFLNNKTGAPPVYNSDYRIAASSALLSQGVAIAGYTEIDKDGVYAATPAIGPYYVGS